MTPYLSIIVPAFHCRTIDNDLKKLDLFLSHSKINYEIICVVDGLKTSKDQTFNKAQKLKRKNVKVLFYPENKGKGYAVRFGFTEAKGQIIGFFDAGSDIDVNSLETALSLLTVNKADIVIASKRHPKSLVNHYPARRRFLSSFSQLLTKISFGLSVSDTQVGLKLFRRRVIKKVLPKLSINGFAFDVELLAIANLMGFRRIYESPVTVRYNKSSTIKFSSLFQFAFDYIKIAYHIRMI